MLALRIEASNFRQFEELELFLPATGIIGFSGLNGAGKSTIFNIIDWILHGKYKGVKNQGQLKMHKSAKNAATYGVFDFIFNGDFYRVRRDLVNSPKRNYVQKGKHQVATGTSNVNSYIQNLFKMDQESFRVCYYASQGDFDALAQMGDSPRAAMISKLLRIETIDEAAKKARDDKKVLEVEMAEAKKHLKDDEELVQKLQQIQEQEKQEKQNLLTVEKELNEIELRLAKLNELKQSSDLVFEQYQELSSKISNLETKKHTLMDHSLKNAKDTLSSLENKHERLKTIIDKKELYFSLIQKKDELNEAKEQFLSVRRIEKQAADVLKNIEFYTDNRKSAEIALLSFDEVEQSMIRIESDIVKVEHAMDGLKGRARELQTILNVNKQNYQDIVNDKQKFEELGENVPCPTCKRPLGDHLESQLTHLEEKKQTLIRDTAKLKVEYDEIVAKGLENKELLHTLKKSQQSLQVKFREKSGFNSQLDNSKRELRNQNTILSDLQKQRLEYPEAIDFDADAYKSLIEEIQQVTPVYEEILTLQNQVEEIPKIKTTIDEINHEITSISTTCTQLNKEREELQFDKEKHFSLSKDIDQERTAADRIKDRRYEVQTLLHSVAGSIQAVNKDIQDNILYRESMKDKQQEIVDLAKLDELFKSYKQNKLAELAPILSDKMSDMIDLVTDGLYDRIELDKNYSIHIYRDGEKHPLEIFSGGEQKLAALLQRIAVSQLLVEQKSQASFDMIALDEVTSAFDENRQDSMLEMLRGLNDMFKQILIVSHNEHVKDSFDHTLIIERGTNKKSTVRWALTESGNESFDVNEIKTLIQQNLEAAKIPNEDEELA